MNLAALTATQRSNFRHLTLDIMWWGVLAGSTIAFISVYLVRLGATTYHLGLLAAGPALVNLLISIPAGNWLKKRNLNKTTFLTSLLFRGGYLILIFLPNLLPTASSQVWTVIIIYLVTAIPGTALAIGFNALFADLVEPDWRPYVVGRRNAVLALSITMTSLVVGTILEQTAFPQNYQIVFAIGFLGASFSSFHLYQLQPSGTQPVRVGQPIFDRGAMVMQRNGDVAKRFFGLRFLARQTPGTWLRLDLLRGSFGSFLLAYLFFYIAQYLPISLFPVYFVQELGISDSILSISGALFYLGMMVISLRLDHLSQKLGKQTLLSFGVISYAIFPLMISIWGNEVSVLAAHALGGIAWGFAGSSTLNNLMDKTPEDDRPAYMALNHITLNIGILAGSFLGPALGELIGIQTAIFAGAIFRIFSGILVRRWA
jgi:predicted MFS family arabinose efflux permease